MRSEKGQWEYHSRHRSRSEADLTALALCRFAPNYQARISKGRYGWYIEWRKERHG